MNPFTGHPLATGYRYWLAYWASQPKSGATVGLTGEAPAARRSTPPRTRARRGWPDELDATR